MSPLSFRFKNLSFADFEGSDLTGADFTGANLHKVNLKNANLQSACFAHANLSYAILTNAKLARADLTGANLSNANLIGADLTEANLTKALFFLALLMRSNFTNANLEGADLHVVEGAGAKFAYANLRRARLSQSDIENADFSHADLRHAQLLEAHLCGGKFNHANLQDADLGETDLAHGDLRGTDFRSTDLRTANLVRVVYDSDTRWPPGFQPPPPAGAPQRMRAYGAMTGPVLKLGKAGVPYRAKDFKQRHPQEFEMLKRLTGGADFSPAFTEKLRQTNITPYDWIVTRSVYSLSLQRRCPHNNLVLLLNIDMSDPAFTERQRDLLQILAKAHRQSKHPYEKGDLFTVGWVRICQNDAAGVWLVEEVQSDVPVVRGSKDDEWEGPERARKAEIVHLMKPYVERFYADALGIVLQEAEKAGAEVEMLTYASKAGDNSPRSVYTELPASMGISAKRASKVLPDLEDEVRWTRPNPKRRGLLF